MKYIVLIHQNRAAREQFNSLPAEVRAEGMAGYFRLNDELQRNGEYVAAEALVDDAASVLVTAADGRAVRTDGPFAEAKELLAGFYLIDVDSVERAVDLAGMIPDVQAGAAVAEIRPVATMEMPEV